VVAIIGSRKINTVLAIRQIKLWLQISLKIKQKKLRKKIKLKKAKNQNFELIQSVSSGQRTSNKLVDWEQIVFGNQELITVSSRIL
jgi:adenine C2-methylase RlmN of 23S rRNA A2503 and tRNA A37